jgi:glycosyltransferase involved in cell wall biosynthesis
MPLTGDTPFVVFGDDWGRYPSTIQHTFRHVAARYPVLWLNGIGHRVPGLNRTDIRRGWEKLLRMTRGGGGSVAGAQARFGGGVPAAIVEPRVLPWHQVPWIHAFNTASLLRTITRRLSALGLGRRPVLVTGSPPSVGVVGRLNELVSVYYCLDDFLHYPTYTASMLEPLERRLLDRVDLVVATAETLTRSKRPRSGRAYHLPQGVNYDHFAAPRPEPPDLAGIPTPRIGFAGTVSTQCDVALLSRLARTFPDASLVLVGPVALSEEQLLQVRQPNVHLLGVRSYDALPGYVQHFDVGIIPYVLSPWTVAVDPLKLLEYLAAGLPVVCTAIPEAAKYADTIAVANDADGFVAAVREALAADRAAARARGQALARRHTWERRADALLDLIGDAVEQREAAAGAGARSRPT